MKQSDKQKCIDGMEGSGIFFWGPIISAGIWIAGALAVLFAMAQFQGCTVKMSAYPVDTTSNIETSNDKAAWCHILPWGCEHGK